MKDGVVASLDGVGVEEELGRFVPEDLVWWELKEDFGVGAHLEGFDAHLFPGWELGVEGHDVVLENSETGCELLV